MKMRWSVVLVQRIFLSLLTTFAVVTVPFPALAQSLYGLQGSTIVSINPSTGAVATVGSVPTSGSFDGTSAFDPLGRRLLFLGAGSPGNSTLTVFSLASTSSTQVPVLGSSSFIEYDPASGLVYGLQGSTIVSINPSTGAVATVGSVPTSGSFGGISTFDPLGRRLLFLGAGTPGNSTLTVFSLASTSSTQVSVPGSSSFIEYDPASGLVYGLQGSTIVSINPSTGAVATVGSVPTSGSFDGISAFDPLSRRLLFLGAGTAGNSVLSVFSLADASDTQVAVSGSSSFLEADINSAAIPALSALTLMVLALCLVWVALRH